MSKVRSDAHWKQLSPEKLDILDKWIFEENLSYKKAVLRAGKELGFKTSYSSLRRYYGRRKEERAMEVFEDLREDLAEVKDAPGDVNALRAGTMKVLAAFMFRQIRQSPEDADAWGPMVRMILENDHNEAWRELKGEELRMKREFKTEDQRLRKETMAFAKEKFELKTAESALKALPQLLELREAKKDPQTKRYEENIHWNRARRAMFGPGCEVHPESAEEEAAMIAAKKEREERKSKLAQMEREKLKEAQPPPPMSKYYPEYLEKLAKKAQENWEKCPIYEI